MRRAMPKPCKGPSACSVFRIIRSSVPCSTSDFFASTMSSLVRRSTCLVLWRSQGSVPHIHMECPKEDGRLSGGNGGRPVDGTGSWEGGSAISPADDRNSQQQLKSQWYWSSTEHMKSLIESAREVAD